MCTVYRLVQDNQECGQGLCYMIYYTCVHNPRFCGCIYIYILAVWTCNINPFVAICT